MEGYFDNTTAFSELSINNAPQLRCNGGKFTTCGKCEACELGGQLRRTKEWFLRSSDQTQRQFVLGLVHRYNSTDLHEYTNALLTTLEGKDFIYARSRNRPSLKEDSSGPPSDHALNTAQLRKDILDCLNWFEDGSYWTKCNFMLGIMQSCSAQLLHIIGSESRSFCLVHEDQYLSETESKPIEDSDAEESSTQNEGLSLKVAFNSIYQTSSTSLTPDIMDRPRSAHKSVSFRSIKKPQDSGLSATQPDWNCKDDLTSLGPRRLGSAKQRHLQGWSNVSGVPYDNELYDDDYISVEPSSADLQLSSSCLLLQHHKDFIRCLPVHLSKLILSYLDKASLVNCLCISKHWRFLCEEVQRDVFVHQIMMEEVMMMQGATAKGLNAKYARKLKVCVPKYEDEMRNDNMPDHSEVCLSTSLLRSREDELKFRSMAYCYEGIETIQVEMEERNLFCGAYNVFVLQDSEDPNRCTTYNGETLAAVGSSDRRVKLINASTGRCEKVIKGHSGSVRSLLINEKRGFVLSGSYDTSIRYWNIRDGKCHSIYRGHRGTVLCVALSGNVLASGSRDKSVRVWNFETAKCRRTFRHRHVVLSVDVSNNLVVSGCEGWKVKVWDIESATLIKSLDGHQCPVTGVTFNKYHIVSSSTDCYALAWSAIGQHTKCLQAFRHPKAVHCIKLAYCRVITGAADGKLRIWSLLTGDCLRIIRGNSKNDVITSLYVADNRIVINTLSNLLILNFEAISWKYNLPPDRPESLGTLNNFAGAPPRARSRSYVRAQKLARGVHVDKLIEPAASAPSFGHLLDRSVSMTPFSLRRNKRVSSAPANVTRQVTQSVEQHVQRLHRARKHTAPEGGPQRKLRPQSSPAHLRSSVNAPPESANVQSALEPAAGYTTSRHYWHMMINRGRSAPAVRIVSGWTTSAQDVTLPHNKLMPTPAQSREHVKRRAQSADLTKVKNADSAKVKNADSAKVKNANSAKAKIADSAIMENGSTAVKHNPISETASCLNLKTYSAQLLNERTRQKHLPQKKRVIGKTQRPLSCLT